MRDKSIYDKFHLTEPIILQALENIRRRNPEIHQIALQAVSEDEDGMFIKREPQRGATPLLNEAIKLWKRQYV